MSDTFSLKFKAELDGKEQISSVFDEASRGAKRFESNLQRALKSAGAGVSAFAGKAGSELQAFAGKELGGSLGSQARGVLQLRDAINKLAVSAGGGQEMVGGLKDEIQKISVASNQLQGDVTQAMQAFVERTGDLKTARDNMALYGKVATATSASLEDVARTGESLSSKFHITDQAKAFAILVQQAKAGSIELRDLAFTGASLFTTARAANIGGKGRELQGLREIGGLAETIAGGARGKDKATAADTEVMIRNMFSQVRQKSGAINALGVKVTGRDYIDVIRDLIVKTGGDEEQLGKIFKNERAFRGVSTLARQYKDEGGFATLNRLTNVNADTGQLDRDFATRTSTGDQKLKAQQIARLKFIDEHGGGLAEFAAKYATELQLAGIAGGGLGKVLSLIGNLPGGKGGGGGIVGGLSDLTAMPVRVVNWPGGGLPGNGSAPVSITDVAKKAVPLGAVAGGPAAVAAALLAYTAVHDQLLDIGMTEATNPLIKKANAEKRAGRLVPTKGFIEGAYSIFSATPGYKEATPPPVVNITIHSNENLDVKGDTGTRDPKVMDRRGGGG